MGILSQDPTERITPHDACYERQKAALRAQEEKFYRKMVMVFEDNRKMRDIIFQLELKNGLSMEQIRATYSQWFKV